MYRMYEKSFKKLKIKNKRKKSEKHKKVFLFWMFVASWCSTFFVCSVCLLLYGPYCHSALKFDISTLFTTFFLRTSLQSILLNHIIVTATRCCGDRRVWMSQGSCSGTSVCVTFWRGPSSSSYWLEELNLWAKWLSFTLFETFSLWTYLRCILVKVYSDWLLKINNYSAYWYDDSDDDSDCIKFCM